MPKRSPGGRPRQATRRRCSTGKMRYRDAIAAKLSLATLVRQDKPGHTERRAYRCTSCGGWHLTSHL